MFDRILVALDGSEDSRSAGRLALELAALFESEVTGLSVIDTRVIEGPAVETLAPLWGEVTGRPFQPEVMRVYRERGAAILDDFCEAAAERGLACVERYLEFGVAEEVIVERAASADLLALGRRGEHARMSRHGMGATLWRVSHRSPAPMLVVGDGARIPRLPLVAYDSSSGAARALSLAVEFARAAGVELRVVHAGGDETESVLDTAHEALGEQGVSWESVRLDAEPVDAVEEALARWGADALFMGAFGRGRIRDLLFGSHTSSIFERVGVPVVLAR